MNLGFLIRIYAGKRRRLLFLDATECSFFWCLHSNLFM